MDFKIGHSGKTDVKYYADTDKHKQIFYVSFILSFSTVLLNW